MDLPEVADPGQIICPIDGNDTLKKAEQADKEPGPVREKRPVPLPVGWGNICERG